MSNNINDTQFGSVSNWSTPKLYQVYSQIYMLTSGQALILDFKTLANQNKIDAIQGIWIDNSQGTDVCSVTVNATLQTIFVPIGFQAIMPLYMTADNVITVTGAGSVPIILNNFPTPASVWKAS